MTETSARITRTGGPEAIEWVREDLPAPGPGEVRMRSTAIGINFIDIYHRSGIYPVPLPSGLGVEAAGLVEALGEGVDNVAVGDRVYTFGPALGAYSTARNVSALTVFKIPDGISDDLAAAALLKACTVEALAERCADVQPGDSVLVHAAAGGVGLILTQWLRHKGAHIIALVSSEEKAAMARNAGADLALLTGTDNLAEQVLAASGGDGVKVSFDSVGADSWELSLQTTRPRGLIISYGNASGPVTGVNLGVLSANGSLFVTRPTLGHYYITGEDRAVGFGKVFDMLSSGKISVAINQRYALTDAAQAHRDLADRKTTGSSLLIP